MIRRPLHHPKKALGQSIAEYGIIGTLIGVVCIGALMTFRDNFEQQVLGDIVGFMAGTRTTSGGTGLQVNGQGVVPPPGPNQYQYSLGNGYVINVPQGGGLATTVSTAGSLGGQTTLEMANIFRQIAEQLATNPNSDPSLIAMFNQLANRGHALGVSEIQSDTWCQAGNYCGILDSGGGSVQTALLNHMNNVQTNHALFQEQYDMINLYLDQNPNALPPNVQHAIQFEVNQINTIAGAYTPANVTTMTGWDGQGSTWDYAYDAQLTHQSANAICANGGDGYTCIQ